MKIKDYFLKKLPKKDAKERQLSLIHSNAKIQINGTTEKILLCHLKDLSTVQSLKGFGTWKNEDFNQLKRKLKVGLSPLSANVSLQKIDLGEVNLSQESPDISFKELFSFCANIQSITLPIASEYPGGINFNATFKGCCKLQQIQNLETYKRITDLCSTFCYCNLLSEIRLSSSPLPRGNEDTFQKTSCEIIYPARHLKIILPKGIHIPSIWSVIRPKNSVILYEEDLV